METKSMSRNQAIVAITLFTFGNSVVMGINSNVGQDIWIAILLASVLTVPLFLMYARILDNFPNKNLFEISEILFGKVFGKIVTVLLVWYSLYLAALVLRNYSEFTQVGTMLETPQVPILILLVITTAYLARSGPRAIGKWSVIMILIVLLVIGFILIISFNQMKLDTLLPVMEFPFKEILFTSFQIITFPYAETIVFLCIGCSFPGERKNKGIFLGALLFSFVIFENIVLRNLTLLGKKMIEVNYFPSFVTARVVEAGDFLSRIEGSISTNFLLEGIVKIAVCLLAASKGLKSLLNLQDYKAMVAPSALMAFALALLHVHSTMEMFEFVQYYAYFALPFQLAVPLLLFIFGEVYIRKNGLKPQKPPKPAAAKPAGPAGSAGPAGTPRRAEM
jgi:spore germination protein KB